MRAALLVLPFPVLLAASGGPRAVTPTESPPPALARLVEQLDAGRRPTTREVVAAKAVPGAAAAIAERLPRWPPPARATALRVLADLGAPLVQARPGAASAPAPVVDDPLVVAALVARLGDEARDVRTAAAALLVERVPDPLARDHTAEIVATLARQPATGGAALLLGKTGAAAAERLLRGEPRLRDAAPADTQAALGRLGDRDAEAAVIEACRREQDPEARAEHLLRVGYLGTPLALLHLAREVRTPEAYAWVLGARRSMRVHVVEALHRALPAERIFWRPAAKPEGDAYYEELEAWVTKHLGVTWTTPRPPFLYEEDAPAGPR